MSAFKSIRVRRSQGTQYIKDLRSAVPRGFRGLPAISAKACAQSCDACRDVADGDIILEDRYADTIPLRVVAAADVARAGG